MVPTIQDRVAKGATMLDRWSPGWRDKIDREILDINHPFKCILGQTYGVYSEGCLALGISPTPHVEGNSFSYGLDGASFAEGAELTEEWKKVLAE